MIRAHISLRLLAFTVIFALLFTYLGFWQIDRAESKKVLLAQQASLEALPVARLSELAASEIRTGRRVVVEGLIDPENVFLLDNVVVEGQVGFEVLHPIQLESGESLLINRGFVSAGMSRETLPVVPFLNAPMTALGVVYVSDWANSDMDLLYTGWPRIVPTQSPKVLASVLDTPLLPWVLRLDEADPNSLPRYWVTTVMSPEQHTGYAVQWFAMAFVLVGLFIVSAYKKRREGGS